MRVITGWARSRSHSARMVDSQRHLLAQSWRECLGHKLTKNSLMFPIFVSEDPDADVPISSLPGLHRYGINKLAKFLTPLVRKGLRSVLIFALPSNGHKDDRGSRADDPQGPAILAIKLLRETFPSLFIACDVCLCPYTAHGHCGILHPDDTIDTPSSVDRIAEVALNYAKAGVHCVAPSDMMDGRIQAIKKRLAESGLGSECMVMSYSAKFCSELYGPFRAAASSAPSFSDRTCYQLPPPSRGLAIRAIERDIREGADIVMVKPALPNLDIIAEATRLAPDLLIACYQVGGELMMIRAAADAGVVDLKAMTLEAIKSMMGAGATLIVTYFAAELLDQLDE